MPQKKLVVLTIVGTVEPTVGINELKNFAIDALGTWGGQRHPDDHLFSSMGVSDVKVTTIGRVDQ